MDKLCEIKEKLVDKIYEVVTTDVDRVNACELGEVIDVVKDIHQIKYYEAVVDAMHSNSDLPSEVTQRMYYHNPEVETVEEVMTVIDKLAEESTAQDKVTLKEKLMNFISNI